MHFVLININIYANKVIEAITITIPSSDEIPYLIIFIVNNPKTISIKMI